MFDDKIEDAAVRAQRDVVARAKSGLDGAAVQVQRAELNLARTRLKAPFAGRAASVKVVPGQTQFTRMLSGAWSTAMLLVSIMIAAFDTLYAACPGMTTSPASEPTFTILPPPDCLMARTAAREQ